MESTVDISQQSGGKLNNMILRTVGIVKNNTKDPFLKADDKDIEMQGSMDELKKKIDTSYDAMSEIINEMRFSDE